MSGLLEQAEATMREWAANAALCLQDAAEYRAAGDETGAKVAEWLAAEWGRMIDDYAQEVAALETASLSATTARPN